MTGECQPGHVALARSDLVEVSAGLDGEQPAEEFGALHIAGATTLTVIVGRALCSEPPKAAVA